MLQNQNAQNAQQHDSEDDDDDPELNQNLHDPNFMPTTSQTPAFKPGNEWETFRKPTWHEPYECRVCHVVTTTMSPRRIARFAICVSEALGKTSRS